MNKTTVEHQAGGCRLCPVSLEDESTQVAYLLCPDCQPLARAARRLLRALKDIVEGLDADGSILPRDLVAARKAIKKAEEKNA